MPVVELLLILTIFTVCEVDFKVAPFSTSLNSFVISGGYRHGDLLGNDKGEWSEFSIFHIDGTLDWNGGVQILEYLGTNSPRSCIASQRLRFVLA